MLKTRNSLILDHTYTNNTPNPISAGLIIKKKYVDGTNVDIANIFWDDEISNCYIKTVADNFQNNIVIYEDFKDFIYLVDAAYDYISLVNSQVK